MKIYIDLVFLLNFSYDLLLLMSIDLLLKRHMNFKRLLLASIIGALSLGILFLPFSKYLLFIFKILVSIIMVLVSFKYKNIKYTLTNLMYLYMLSVILGGFLYLLSLEFSYDREGLIFFFDGLSVNYILLLLISPFILGMYIYEHKKYRITYNFNCKVDICFLNNNIIKVDGFIDSGNKLKDPVTKKNVIIISKRLVNSNINIRSPMYVPYKALGKSGIIACFKIKFIRVNDKVLTNYLVGLSDDTFNLNGTDALLPASLWEEI